MEPCENISPPPSGCLFTAVFRAWHSADICSDTMTFTYTCVSWNAAKITGEPNGQFDDEKSCAVISVCSWKKKNLFLVLCMCYGGGWREMWEGGRWQAVACHTFVVHCSTLFPFFFSASSHWFLHLPLFCRALWMRHASHGTRAKRKCEQQFVCFFSLKMHPIINHTWFFFSVLGSLLQPINQSDYIWTFSIHVPKTYTH